MLRRFSYLDSRALDQYLAQLEGSLLQDFGKRTSGKRGGKLGGTYAGVGAEFSGSKEVEITEKREIPAASDFQRVYNLLLESNDVQYLDAFDERIWQQLKRGEFLEIQANIRLPESVSLMSNLRGMQSLVKVMQQVGEDPLKDPERAKEYSAFLELTSARTFDIVPIVFEAVSTPKYTFAAKLKTSFLEVGMEEIEGEATVIGKIIRLLPRGKQEEFFSITPQITSLIRLMNRQQKRKASTTDLPSLWAEKIQGPAVILAILAVFT